MAIDTSAFSVGTDGADFISVDAGEGITWLEGFGGNDVYELFDLEADFVTTIVEQAGGGIDTVILNGYGEDFVSLDGLSLNDNTVEHLTVRNSENIEIVGNALANRLIVANEGVTSDTLDGGAGADTMEGGAGDDEYWIDVSGDVVIEQGEGGHDRVYALANYVLSANVEELVLLDGEGAQLNINGTGNAHGNNLYGNEGNNALSGLGGGDYLAGGSGNDTLLGGDGGDVLEGEDGNDSLNGGNDDDLLFGGDGNDRMDGAAGNDSLEGDDGNDSLLGGAGNDTLLGGFGLDTLDGGAGDDALDGGESDGVIDVLRGGAGNDTYYVGEEAETIVEAAGAGDDTVYSRIDFVLPANVEVLVLLDGASVGTGNAGNNVLRGSFNNDVLSGLAGNDLLDGGGGGHDTLIGGAGNDRYLVNNADDVVVEGAGQGTDTVFATQVNYALGANVENLVLGTGDAFAGVFGQGNELNNSIVAATFDADDVLRGAAGNDTLDGGAGGADSLYGGAGNDTYFLRTFDDRAKAIELKDEGTDTVFSLGSYVLGANLEHLTLLEGGDGGEAIGNELANRLTGSSDGNFLWGRGGNDTMIGGAGDDAYMVEQAGDVVTEAANGGHDHVTSWLPTYTLAANVEDLTLAPMAGQATGIGNNLDNVIVGNALANTLNGLGGNDDLRGGAGDDTLLGGAGNDVLDGGRGADSMVGGTGNDTYFVNSLDDVVNETAAGGGIDQVQSSVSVAELWAGVENLFLTGNAASASGNNLNNQIFGNALRNTLSGGTGNDLLNGGGGADTLNGGAGNDTLDGGFGNDVDTMFGDTGDDTYILDRADDLAIDVPGGAGTDTVVLSFNSSPYSLEGTTIENIVFGDGFNVGTATGNDSNNRLTGNEFGNHLFGAAGNDTLIGNAGDDTLNGGAGNDSMVGGAGNDVYRVDRYVGDVVVEALNGGHDTVIFDDVQATGTYVLPNNVEDLVLSGSEGAAVNLTGNALDNLVDASELGSGPNVLRGGAGNDTLLGGSGNDTLLGEAGEDSLDGGAGVDSMAGGLGNDIYEISDAGDVATEALNQGIDTVNLFGSEGGIANFNLGNNIENLNIATDGVGMTVNANGLANAISFDPSFNIILDALAGNDTVSGGDAIAGAGAIISLDGGDGADTLLIRIGEGGDYTAGLSASNFELIALHVSGAATWDATPQAFDISGGGSLTLSGQSLGTQYRFANFVDSLTLGFANASGDSDLVDIRLLAATDMAVVAPGVEILSVRAEADAALGVTGLDAGAEVVIAGPGSVELAVDSESGDISLLDYSGQGLTLLAGESGESHTINLDNVSTTIDLGAEGFTAITLDTTGAAGASDVTLTGTSLGALGMIGEDGDVLMLQLELFTGESVLVDSAGFLGNLVLRNRGGEVTYEAGDSVDWLDLDGEGSDVLNYGNNLGSEDIIEDENWGGDSDALTASLSAFQGALAISGIESITLNIFEGPNFIDATWIQGDFTLHLTGSSVVTIENLQGNLDAAGRAGVVNAYLVNEDAFGGYAVAGGNAADELWVEGSSDDTLSGGLGNDTLLGGDGMDRFVFDSALGAGNVDTILDFDSGNDLMVLDLGIFTSVVGEAGVLNAAELFASAGNGGVASEADDRIIYDTDTGALYYDADGSGGAASVQFAQLGTPAVHGTGIPIVDFEDFILVA